jgi:ABC-type multidrug transport system fused ATPase/permease subunit
MVFDICKLGNPYFDCSVSYKTDPSPFEDKKFKPVSGRLYFGVGVSIMSISVPIIDDSEATGFDATREFSLSLSDPEGCTLGLYLFRARCKILGRAVFPTTRYEKETREDHTTVTWQGREGISFQMLRECMGYLLKSVKLSRRLIVLDQLSSLIFILNTHIMLLVVNLLTRKDGEQPTRTEDFLARFVDIENATYVLAIYSAMFFIPNVSLHLYEYKRAKWDVPGLWRKILQDNLMTKFLNYDELHRGEFSDEVFLRCVKHDVMALVKQGCHEFCFLYEAVGRLVLICFYELSLAIAAGEDAMPIVFTIAVSLLYPPTMFAFVWWRAGTTRRTQKKQETSEVAVIDSVSDAVANYRMTFDDMRNDIRRTMVSKQIDKRIAVYDQAVAECLAVRTNNEWCPKWLAVVSQSIAIIGGSAVIVRNLVKLDLGTFLALLILMKCSGETFTLAYKTYLTMADSFVPMWRIVRFMNQPTDVAKRKAANHTRRKRGEEMRTALCEGMAKDDFNSGIPVVDMMPMILEQVGFRFDRSSTDLLKDITIDITQGTLVCIMGPPSSGKGTFLELMGAVYEQQIGTIFVPPHLRVLHVSRDASLIAGSLLDNLFFGVCEIPCTPENLDPAVLTRGLRICERLNFPERLLELAQVYAKPGENVCAGLSRSNRKLIHLARALIYNPEVIVVHTPGMYFTSEQRQRVVSILADYVQERGLEMDEATRKMRRLRTCIFTSDDDSSIDAADVIFECRNGSLSRINNVDASRIYSTSTAIENVDVDRHDAVSMPQPAVAGVPTPISYTPYAKLVVQFSIAIYYAEKSEGMMVFDVTKLGDPDAECSVTYQTNPSPYEFKRFKPVRGELKFGPGVPTLSFCVPILKTEGFDSTREFSLSLCNPVDCTLGLYLKNARCKIVDRSWFPTGDDYEQHAIEDHMTLQEQHEKSFGMLADTGRFIKKHTVNAHKLVVFNQMENAYVVMQILAMQIIVNMLTNKDTSENANESLQIIIFLSVILIIPNVLLHYFDYRRCYWNIIGMARRVLQENLMNKVLNYEESLRAEFTRAQIIHPILHDVPNLVKAGYMNFFEFFHAMGLIVMLGFYAFVLAIAQGGDAFKLILGTIAVHVVVYLVVFFVFIKSRQHETYRLQEKQDTAEILVIDSMGDTVANYRTICDYFRLPKATAVVDRHIDGYNAAVANVAALRANNEWCPKWISLVILSGLIVIGGSYSARGTLTIGTYLVLVLVTAITGNSLAKAYKANLIMYDAFLPLRRVVRLMNLPTGLPKRAAANRARRNRGEEMRAEYQV